MIVLETKDIPPELLEYFEPVNDQQPDVWKISTKPFRGAHFATFPPDLIEPCILAGTSAKGCCPECGAPWERVVERENPTRTFPDTGKGIDERKADGTNKRAGMVVLTNHGWRPTCTCGCEDTEPCIVFDPFMGAGTTALVAKQNGRSYFGIELNPDYVEMAERRIAETMNTGPEPVEVFGKVYHQEELFCEAE